METLRDVEELDGFMKKDKYADPEFTKKLWAYLTVNQMLAERWGETWSVVGGKGNWRAILSSLEPQGDGLHMGKINKSK